MSPKPKATPPVAAAEATPVAVVETTSVAVVETTPVVTAPVVTAPAAEAPVPVAAPVASITKSGIDATVSSLKEGVAKATAGIKTTTVQVKQGMEKAMKTAEDFVAFNQSNVEAIVKSSQIWSAGVQDLSKQVAATAQAQFEETVSVFKALSGLKSFKDALELQSSFARSAMEKSMAQSSRLTDASLKLTEQALAPITARVTTAVESFSKAA